MRGGRARKTTHDGWAIRSPRIHGGLHGKATSTSLLLTGSRSFRLPESGGFIKKTPNNVEEARKTRLHEYEDVVLERRYTSIQVGLIFREEWFQVGLVDECRALRNMRHT